MFETILIVDDSKLIHTMYEQLLAVYNCELLHAINGVDGLMKLNAAKRVDLILLDLDMPVMDGIQFLERVTEDEKFNEIPIIIVSTRSEKEDIKRCLKLGAIGYLLKPFSKEKLHEIIGRVFSRS